MDLKAFDIANSSAAINTNWYNRQAQNTTNPMDSMFVSSNYQLVQPNFNNDYQMFSATPLPFTTDEYQIMPASGEMVYSTSPYITWAAPIMNPFQIINSSEMNYMPINSQIYNPANNWLDGTQIYSYEMNNLNFRPTIEQLDNTNNVQSIDKTQTLTKIQNSNLFNAKEKKIAEKLPALTQEKLLELKEKATKKGIVFDITVGHRSFEYQKGLLQDWKNPAKRRARGIVARPASPGYSYHNYGYAVDFKMKKGTHKELGKLAESLGWTWGGRFRGNYDPIHIDLRNYVGSTASLLNKSQSNS